MWRATTEDMACRSRSQSAVLPSISVNRKVTVPEGSADTGPRYAPSGIGASRKVSIIASSRSVAGGSTIVR